MPTRREGHALEPARSLAPSTGSTKCSGPAADDDSPLFACTGLPLSASEIVIVKQSELSPAFGCSPQSPRLGRGSRERTSERFITLATAAPLPSRD